MTTVTTGCYAACPIKYLPTGYIVWLIKQGHMKNRWWDFYCELEQRIINKSEPDVPDNILETVWFSNWETEVQQRYASMMTDGRFDWTAATRRSRQALDELAIVYGRLEALFA
jgi:hypothetical protein